MSYKSKDGKTHQSTILIGENGFPVDTIATISGSYIFIEELSPLTYVSGTVTLPAGSDLTPVTVAKARYTGKYVLVTNDNSIYYINRSTIDIANRTFTISLNDKNQVTPNSIDLSVGWTVAEADIVNRVATTSSAKIDSVEFRDLQFQMQLDGDPVTVINASGDLVDFATEATQLQNNQELQDINTELDSQTSELVQINTELDQVNTNLTNIDLELEVIRNNQTNGTQQSRLLDENGDAYSPTNPLAVQLSDGSVNIGTVNAEVEVQLSHIDNSPDAGDVADSVRIGDGVETLEVNADGSINMRVTGGNGEVVTIFSEISSVASLSTSTIVSYIVPVGKTATLNRIGFGGNNIATYEVEINSTIEDRKRTWFGGDLSGVFEFISSNASGVPLVAGDQVTLKVTNFRPSIGDFEGRIQVLES